MKNSEEKPIIIYLILILCFSNCNYSKDGMDQKMLHSEQFKNTLLTESFSVQLYSKDIDPFIQNNQNILSEKIKKRLIIACGNQPFVGNNGKFHDHGNEKKKGEYKTLTMDSNPEMKADYKNSVEDIDPDLIPNSEFESITFEFLPKNLFKEDIFKQIFRILEPGGKFKIYGNPSFLLKNNSSQLEKINDNLNTSYFAVGPLYWPNHLYDENWEKEELSDCINTQWEFEPSGYKPLDLNYNCCCDVFANNQCCMSTFGCLCFVCCYPAYFNCIDSCSCKRKTKIKNHKIYRESLENSSIRKIKNYFKRIGFTKIKLGMQDSYGSHYIEMSKNFN